jgi:hypothetical protein
MPGRPGGDERVTLEEDEMSENLDAFLEGWKRGDAEMILRAVADDFVYDDPIDGRFTKQEFASYLQEAFSGEDGPCGATPGEAFETITYYTLPEPL